MTAVGMALVFVGYSVGLYGWILLKGYDITFLSMFNRQPWPSLASHQNYQQNPSLQGA